MAFKKLEIMDGDNESEAIQPVRLSETRAHKDTDETSFSFCQIQILLLKSHYPRSHIFVLTSVN